MQLSFYNVISYITDFAIIAFSIFIIVNFIKSKVKNYFYLIIGIIFLISGSFILFNRSKDFVNIYLSDKWYLYKDIEGNFSALFPGDITKEEKNMLNEHFIEIMSDLRKQKKIGVFVIDYTKNVNSENLIQANNDHFIKEKNFVILDKKRVEQANYISIEFTMISKDKKYDQKIRYIYNNNILYILSIIGSPIYENDAKKFFDSFQILE